jgi:ketosteroid isomerase-like protein
MSSENLEVVRLAYQRLLTDLVDPPGDEADLLELLDPEIHLDQTRRVLNPASYDGHQGFRQAMGEVREAWEAFRVEPERLIEADDRVVVIETVRARGRGSGVELADRSASVYTLRNGRIVRVVVYRDPAEALDAVGLHD